MTWADETACVSPLSAHLEWPSAEDEDAESSEEGTTAVRHFFLGQLPDDESDGVWEDEHSGRDNSGDRPADPSDDASDFEGFELPAWTGGADLDQSLDEDAPHLEVSTFDTEVPAPSTSQGDDNEPPLASEVDDPTSVAIRPVPLAGGQETDDVARDGRRRGPRSRIAIVAAVVVVLLVSTAVYVGTRVKAEDQMGRRPTPTSVERQSTSTTATTAGSSDAAPDTEPAPASNAASGSAAPASRQGAPKGMGSTQIRAPATGTSGASSPPPAASSGPNASPPPAPTPAPSTNPNPVCQVTPQLCP